jgi:hypothetical protein
MKILEDAAMRPKLFAWHGAILSEDLACWQNQRDLCLPTDLKDLWLQTGGGDLFESETILAPETTVTWADGFDEVNAHHRDKGMPGEFAIFHIELVLSAFRVSDGKYAILDEGGYSVLRVYESLDDWYEEELRKEYGTNPA